MLNVLDHQLELFDRDARSSEWREAGSWNLLCRELDRIIAFGIALLQQIEEAGASAQSPENWSEITARQFVPLFTQWRGAAMDVLATARAFAAKGYFAGRLSEFVHACTRSKFAVEFDRTFASGQFFEQGGRGRRLEDIDAELRSRDQSGG